MSAKAPNEEKVTHKTTSPLISIDKAISLSSHAHVTGRGPPPIRHLWHTPWIWWEYPSNYLECFFYFKAQYS